MKKFFQLTLSTCLILLTCALILCACNNNSTSNNTTTKQEAEETTQQPQSTSTTMITEPTNTTLTDTTFEDSTPEETTAPPEETTALPEETTTPPEETTTPPEETTAPPEETTPVECSHEWADATCVSPMTCSKCGETDGAPNGEHIMGDDYTCVNCPKSFLTPVEEAIEIGMSYEKGKYSTEYYYVKLTLDHQVNYDGFARATIREGLYISVAGGYLSGNAQGSIEVGDTVVFKAKLGAVNSSLTTGGKELRLFEIAAFEIVEYKAKDPQYEVLVEQEMIVPASGTGVAEKRLHYYLDAEGTVRKEIKEFQSKDDTADYREYRFSYDNGKTWTEWIREPLPAREPVGNDEIDENLGYQNAQHVYNPVVGHFVSLQCQFIYIDGYAATEAHYWAGYTRPMHSFLMIEELDGTARDRVLVKYEAGSDYDRATYRTTDYLTTNISRGSDLIVLANGDILFNLCIPVNVACEMAGLDLQEVFPTTGGLGHAWALLVARGVWNTDTQQYDITYSEPVIVDDTLSTRGLSEPMFAELSGGRIICIFRTATEKVAGWTYRLDPNAPACKYYVISEDGGKTFSEPKPWCYEDGEIVYSPSSFCQVVNSEINGKLYWIGNSCRKTEVNGPYPRFPLYLIEINQETGLAIRESVVLIDTRRTGESEKVQLSNFCILENKEIGALEIYLSKLDQFSGKHKYDCETWKYTLYLPVIEKE